MKGTKRSSLVAPTKLKRKKTKLVSNIVTYLKSDTYFFAPLLSNSPPLMTHPWQADDISSMAGVESLGIENVIKKKIRVSEKVKEYLKSDCFMYQPMISSPKLDSSLKGKLHITNMVTMEVSMSNATMREDNNYSNLQSKVVEQTFHNGKINSPKRAQVILQEQRTGVSCETDISPSFSSLQEDKMVKPARRRVTIK